MKAELFINSKSLLGEGPVWNHLTQMLYWADIEGKRIYRHNSTTNKSETHFFDQMPGALCPIDDDNLIIAFADGLAIYNWVKKKLDYQNPLGGNTPKIRANDGKCDPNGNFWIGTMHLDLVPKAGVLYRVDKNFNPSLQFGDRTISNGMAWSADGETMYYIDTFDNCVYAFDFDLETSKISNKKKVITIDSHLGGLDGMTIDTQDKLWIAHWGGSCVRRWDPISQEILETISVPAPHVTSCTFGGKQMNELYITTARSGLTPRQLEEFPLSGGVFKANTKFKGQPTTFFK